MICYIKSKCSHTKNPRDYKNTLKYLLISRLITLNDIKDSHNLNN